MTDRVKSLEVGKSPGFVEISRKRGRIAGFGSPKVPVNVLWCGTNRPRKKHGRRQNGWSFPPAVRELLLQETQGKTVLHFFGGRADFGLRMDVDPETNPDVVGDAYLPPFARDSFDVVILDPPYRQMTQQEKIALLLSAAWVARCHIYWFHTVWIATDTKIPLERAWLIRTGEQCAVRCLQKFRVMPEKREPLAPGEFTRGYPLKYNRWARAAGELFPELTAGKQIVRAPASNQVYIGDWTESPR